MQCMQKSEGGGSNQSEQFERNMFLCVCVCVGGGGMIGWMNCHLWSVWIEGEGGGVE